MSEDNIDERLKGIISLLGHIEIFKTSFSDLNKTAHIAFADDSITTIINEYYFTLLSQLETINGDISDFHAAILTLANEIRSTSPEQKNKKEVPLNPIPTPVEDNKEQRVDGIEETVRKNKNKNELVVNILDYLQERMETEKDEDDE